MRRCWLIVVCLLVATFGAWAQDDVTVVGTVSDEQGQLVAFASVFVREKMVGTVSDELGEFMLVLPEGDSLHITAQYTGYQMADTAVVVAPDMEVNLVLASRTIMLKEVIAYADEDPAYKIMRKAIINAPIHLHDVSHYEAQFYVRGSLKFTRIPALVRMRLGERTPEEFQTYVTESINRLEYTAPNNYTHTVVSEQNNLFSLIPEGYETQLHYVNLNFYNISDDNLIVSPLSPHAFSYYDFTYEGYSTIFGRTTNHIRVTPKNNNSRLVHGTIDIVEDDWQLSALDLTVKTPFGNLLLEQTFVPAREGLWLPMKQNYTLEISILGVRGRGTYIGSLNYKDITMLDVPNALQHSLEEDTDTLAAHFGSASRANRYKRNTSRIIDIIEQENPTNGKMRRSSRIWRRIAELGDTTATHLEVQSSRPNYTVIDSLRVDKGDIYWQYLRPVDLTDDEAQGFAVMMSSERIDSIRIGKKDDGGQGTEVFLSVLGQKPIRLGEHTTLSFSGINSNLVWFNPTTGFTFEQTAQLRSRFGKDFSFEVDARYAYALTARKFFRELVIASEWDKHRFEFVGGKFFTDWKGTIGDPFLTNTFTSLFLKRNYKKMNDRTYLTAHYRLKPTWGMTLDVESHYEYVKPVSNVNDFSFFKRNHQFSANEPRNARLTDEALASARQATTSATLRYTPRLHYYTNRNGQRVIVGSRWPTFEASLVRGSNTVVDESVKFTHMNFAVSKANKFSFSDHVNWSIEGGFFDNAGTLGFSNWKHFRGSDKIVALADMSTGYSGFVTFGPYELSTNEWYVNASVHYQTQSLLLKKLLPLEQFLFTEEAYVRAAHIAGHRTYTELGYGLAHLALVLRTSVFVSFIDKDFESVCFRMAISLADILRRN